MRASRSKTSAPRPACRAGRLPALPRKVGGSRRHPLRRERTLLSGAERVIGTAPDATSALRSLIAFHVDFALAEADVILVQDRELEQLDAGTKHDVRLLQRQYVEHWVDTLSRLRPDRAEQELRVRAHAAFGLLNSTPHSARIPGRRPADGIVRGILEEMAWASLMS